MNSPTSVTEVLGERLRVFSALADEEARNIKIKPAEIKNFGIAEDFVRRELYERTVIIHPE
jgi:hypothetical protein